MLLENGNHFYKTKQLKEREQRENNQKELLSNQKKKNWKALVKFTEKEIDRRTHEKFQFK